MRKEKNQPSRLSNWYNLGCHSSRLQKGKGFRKQNLLYSAKQNTFSNIPGVGSSTREITLQSWQSAGPDKVVGQLKKIVKYVLVMIPQAIPESVLMQPSGRSPTPPPPQVPSQSKVMQPVVNSFEQSCCIGEKEPAEQTLQAVQNGLSRSVSGVGSLSVTIVSHVSQSLGPARVDGQLKKIVA